MMGKKSMKYRLRFRRMVDKVLLAISDVLINNGFTKVGAKVLQVCVVHCCRTLELAFENYNYVMNRERSGS